MTFRNTLSRLGRTSLLAGAAALAFSFYMAATPGAVADQGGQGGNKGQGAAAHGKGGSGGSRGSMRGMFRDLTGEDDDSDRPDWAGQPGGKTGGGGQPDMAGSKRGDLFGDLWIILRDENGIPVLVDWYDTDGDGEREMVITWKDEDGDGVNDIDISTLPALPDGETLDYFPQPLDITDPTNPVPIALDEEGAPVDATLTTEVELGRLNVGRAPVKVLDRRADEVVALLMDAEAITTDAAGRLVITVDGEAKTIDSPLENLAIYVALLTTGSIPGLTPDDLVGTDYDFLVDGVYDQRDLDASTAFLAAATDKTGAFTSDEIAYIDAFLSINTSTTGTVTYSVIDYSTFSYDRSDTYSGVMVDVLVLQSDGTYKVESVDIYAAVFGSTDASDSGSLDAYTLAADDAREVIEFIHEYAVPAETTN